MLTLTQRRFDTPTLSLYLGGTGIEVGSYIRHLLTGFKKDSEPIIEPFYIDAQTPAIDDLERSRHYGYRNLDQFFAPIYAKFAKERFPENLGKAPVQNSYDGCGVTRIFGAASLVAQRDDFLDLVELAVGRLKEARRPTQRIQVFLTASACGGTGAGMIIDAAAMIRHFFLDRGGEDPRILLFLVGPSAIFGDTNRAIEERQKDRMRASTYSLIKELHHFSEGNPFRSAYRLRDEVVELSNRSDHDRLFDWVFYVDGLAEGRAARSAAEVAWATAEVQLHLCSTEVGRRVIESLPNRREDRIRGYADEFIHPDNKQVLDDGVRRSLGISARRTFLASFAVRNVRFPVEEVKEWFRWHWLVDSLSRILERNLDDSTTLVDRLDRALGISNSQLKEEGLLADLGLSGDGLLRIIESGSGVDSSLDGLRFAATDDPREPITGAGDLLAKGSRLVTDFKRASSLAETGIEVGGSSAQGLIEKVTNRWSQAWREGFLDEGRISKRLWEIAWDPAKGRGLKWLDMLLVHAAEILMGLARREMPRKNWGEIEQRLSDLEANQKRIVKETERERNSLRYFWRSLASKKEGAAPGNRYEARTRNKIARQIRDLRIIQDDLIKARSGMLAGAIAARAWLLAAQSLLDWRERFVVPSITVAENAHATVSDRRDQIRATFTSRESEGKDGEWRDQTTLPMVDDGVLSRLSSRLRNRVWIESSIGKLLAGEGISRERLRLNYATFRSVEGPKIVDILYSHVRSETDGVLSFLDRGWNLQELRPTLLVQAADALDRGSEPLTSFSQAALGLKTQSYFLCPSSLLLPNPYGRKVGQMSRLASVDPHQLGVISFTFGIPPNALEGIDELFEHYTLRIGDKDRHSDAERFPLHVFHNASETFAEPYSPIEIGFRNEQLEAKRELESLLGRKLRLSIRELDETAVDPLEDWNIVVELTELLLRELRLQPWSADELFSSGRYPQLERLCRTRLRRWPALGTLNQQNTPRSRGGNGSDNSPEPLS
jgi:hypothetical protein